jgi:hypothetical protein
MPSMSATRSQEVHKAEKRTTKTRNDDKYIHSLRKTQLRLPMQQTYKKMIN